MLSTETERALGKSQGKLPAKHALGLALSAGGARGAYQIGCWKAFIERDLQFHACAGSSIGALNAALVVQGDWDRAHDLWATLARSPIPRTEIRRLRRLALKTAVELGLLLAPLPKVQVGRLVKAALSSAVLFRRRGSLRTLSREGLLNLESFRPMVSTHLDIAKVLDRPTPVLVTASKLPGWKEPTGAAHWFKLQDFDVETAWKLLAASMSLPVLCQSVELEGGRYRDGGFTQWLPIGPLYESGFRKIIAVSTRPGLNYKPDDYPDCEITVVSPERSLGRFPFATLRFREEAVFAWMDQGYDDAQRVLERG
ncbi:MAG: patatin-like phospholipase family protein [Thermodesulfobacteriota bacterium]